jgi:BASS family bile acid:Na+ symporter
MAEILTLLLKIALVIFMAGNLLEMGLRLDPRDALRGLCNPRFVALSLVWGFVFGPAVAYAVTLILPIAPPYAMGLILLGMTPGAPFLPMIVEKAKGDLGYTAAFMLLAALGTVVFMPLAVPLMVQGLTVSAWAIAQPLIVVLLLPLALGMAVLHLRPILAKRLQPLVKQVTIIATLAVFVLCLAVYGAGLLGVAGSLAVAAQIIFFTVVTFVPYLLGVGLPHEQKVVLSTGMATRNLGAALAPLFAAAAADQRAIIMVVLGLPIMVVFALLAAKCLGAGRP